MRLSELIESDYGKNISSVIYKLTNIINGKVYIGQTKNSLRKRLISHISQAKPNTKSKKHYLQYAIIKYGLDNFVVDILETCPSKLLNDREKFWIKKFNSAVSTKGYNCTYGGDGNNSSREIRKSTRQKISLANRIKWKDPLYKKHQIESRKESWKNRSIKVVQLDLHFSLVKTWGSKKEAISVTSNNSLARLTNEKPIIYSKDFIWMTLNYYNSLNLSEPLIIQLDNNNNIVGKYYSYKAANIALFRITGRHGDLQHTLLGKYVKSKGTKCGGFIWKLYKDK